MSPRDPIYDELPGPSDSDMQFDIMFHQKVNRLRQLDHDKFSWCGRHDQEGCLRCWHAGEAAGKAVYRYKRHVFSVLSKEINANNAQDNGLRPTLLEILLRETMKALRNDIESGVLISDDVSMRVELTASLVLREWNKTWVGLSR